MKTEILPCHQLHNCSLILLGKIFTPVFGKTSGAKAPLWNLETYRLLKNSREISEFGYFNKFQDFFANFGTY